jgi:Putative restriction endonuclease
MPETRRHLGLRTALFQILEAAFADRATLGSEQFVYWDPTDPRACCAPDVMLRLGPPDAPFNHWRVWERGAPHLAIEVISASDFDKGPWDEKLARYLAMGVQELVRFDADDTETPFRIWDRGDFELVERDRALPDFARCRTLDVFFCVRHDDKLGPMLRLARDAEGLELFPTPDEARRRADDARQRADDARLAAEARVRELEAELARRTRDESR